LPPPRRPRGALGELGIRPAGPSGVVGWTGPAAAVTLSVDEQGGDEMKTRRVMLIVAGALVVAGLTACQPQTELEPVAEPDVTGTETTVVKEMAGVRLEVDSDAWEGDPEVAELVTPIRVEIVNESERPLWIRFQNFALLGAYDRYSVLPVFAFDDENGEAVLVEGYVPVPVADFSYEEYYVTDLYNPAYPEFAVWEHALVIDDEYHGRYAATWDELPLPSAEMQRWALPEGVLPTGSNLTGFLFFEGLHPGEERVNFLAQLEDAMDGDYFGALMVPMEAEGPLEP
jgi:hypothetical protein